MYVKYVNEASSQSSQIRLFISQMFLCEVPHRNGVLGMTHHGHSGLELSVVYSLWKYADLLPFVVLLTSCKGGDRLGKSGTRNLSGPKC